MGPTPAEAFTSLGALPPDVGEWCFSPALLLGGICKGVPPQRGLMHQVRFFLGRNLHGPHPSRGVYLLGDNSP